MNAPQIIVCVLLGLDIVLTALVHGRKKTGEYNVLTTIIANAITISLLYWGGFFN